MFEKEKLAATTTHYSIESLQTLAHQINYTVKTGQNVKEAMENCHPTLKIDEWGLKTVNELISLHAENGVLVNWQPNTPEGQSFLQEEILAIIAEMEGGEEEVPEFSSNDNEGTSYHYLSDSPYLPRIWKNQWTSK